MFLALAGCASGSSAPPAKQTAGLSHTLNLAWQATDMTPDPADWYGLNVELEQSLYQTLLQYKANSSTIEGQLATSWKISPNGKVYTFHLRSGVKFHDGTPLNCAAVKYSWAREIKIHGGPSYMLANVASMACPSPLTFVVTLSRPTAAFLAYQCSLYGPAIVSPATVRAHLGTNFAQTYLTTHDAGTGPYTLVSSTNRGVELKAFPGYWGPKPYYTKVIISIVPDASTEVLELDSGQLGYLANAVPVSDLSSLSTNPKLRVSYYPATFQTMLFLNTHTGIFTNAKIRESVKYALNKKLITRAAFGPTGKPSTQFTPFGVLPSGAAADNWSYDPSRVAAIVKTLPTKTVSIAYTDYIAGDQLFADEIQVELQAVGLNATVTGINSSQFESLPEHPAQDPDIVISTINPDTAEAEDFFEIYTVKGGVLNVVDSSVPKADALVDRGSVSSSTSTQLADWNKAVRLYVASDDWIPVTDNEGYLVTQATIKHVVHHSILNPFGTDIGLLSP